MQWLVPSHPWGLHILPVLRQLLLLRGEGVPPAERGKELCIGAGIFQSKQVSSSLFLRTVSFKVASRAAFHLQIKREGREERERSTDVNYWVLLSGSPTEPVAMATYSGCGPLWGGLGAKNCREASWKQQCEVGPRLSVFLESFLV